MHQELGRDTVRTAGPNGPQGCPVPRGVMVSNKTDVKKEERGRDIGSDSVCLPKELLRVVGPALWEWLKTLSSPTFTFLILSPIPLGESERVAATHLPARLNSKLKIMLLSTVLIFCNSQFLISVKLLLRKYCFLKQRKVRVTL